MHIIQYTATACYFGSYTKPSDDNDSISSMLLSLVLDSSNDGNTYQLLVMKMLLHAGSGGDGGFGGGDAGGESDGSGDGIGDISSTF